MRKIVLPRHTAAALMGVLLLLLCLITRASAAEPELTVAEEAWLRGHERLRVQLAEDWPPYNYTEDGEPRGYVNDYIVLLAGKLGLAVDFVGGFSWSEYVAMLEEGKLDCITNMTITPERRKHFLFSRKSVVDVFNGLLTLKARAENADLEKLRGKTLAVARGYAQEELLEMYYPEINLLPTENLLDSIRQVMAGRADAAIGAHAVFNYYIASHLLDEVRSVPITGNIIFPSAPHHLAVKKGETVLLGLLDKAAASISREELDDLKKRWYLEEKEVHLRLSEAERSYLARKERLNLCVDPDWMPMEAIRDGRHVGMAAEYMELLAGRLATKIVLVPTRSWGQTLEYAKERKCDIVSLAMSTPARRLYLSFTRPYFSTPLVVATRESAPYIADLGTLGGKRVGVKKGYAFGRRLREKFPGVEIVAVDSLEEGLKMVRDGDLQGFIGSLPTVVYAIQQNFPGDLKIAGNAGAELELRMGLRNDEPLLLSSMNKAIASISEEEQQQILNRWVAVQYEGGTDYTLVFRVLAGSAVLVLLLLYRQVTLNRFNRRLQQRNREIVEKSELLQKTQEQLLLTQYAVDSCSFPIFWLQRDPAAAGSRIVHANRAAMKHLGYTLDELRALEPRAIAAELAVGEKGDGEHEAKKGGGTTPTTAFRRRDGSTFPVELHISSFTYAANRYSFIFFNDITAQREMEEKLHRSMKMEAVGLMAGGVAHDLNNILSGVVSYPELLLHQLEEDDPMRPKLQAIKNSGERAAQVVDDLLTMARGVAAVHKTTNLNTLVRNYIESPEFQRLQERFPRVSCSLNLARELKNVNCSPLHIGKAIMNLVTNGYEATPPEGEVVLSTCNFRIEPGEADNHALNPGDYVVFEVEDSGPGISREALGHIFEPFYSKKEMGRSGTGLGLSIVWNAAHDHDGGVTAANGDRGARFRLFLPATDEAVEASDETVMEEDLHGGGEKVLVVDDEEQQLDIAREMLHTLGYDVSTASSGEEAVARLERERFDLVLLDMIMSPGIGGRETYARISSLRPGQKAVIVSGFSADGDVAAARAMGVGEFVRKPYSLRALAAAIRNALRPER